MFLEGFISENLYLLICAFAFIVCLLLFIYLIESSNLVKIYKGIPEKSSKTIYGYLDKKGNLISFSNEFYEKINVSTKNKKWYKKVSTIYFEGMEINYKKVLNILKKNKDVINFTVELESESYNVSFKKVPIFSNKEICGYVLFDEEYQTDNNINLLNMMDELQAPLAYYAGEIENINLNLNASMQMRLGLKADKMSYNDLKRFVFEEDMEIFLLSTKEMINNIRIQYRLKTIKGLELFEEVKHFNEGKVSIIVSLMEMKEEKIWFDNKVLVNAVNELINDDISFGGILLSYKSLLEESENGVNPLVKDIIGKHLKTIQKELLGEDDFITKVSDYEFILLFKDNDRFESVVNSIYNNESILLKFEMGFAGEMVNIKNKLGISYSLETFASANDFMNALNSALSLTNKEGYDKDYSIYSVAVKEPEKLEEEYSFEKCIINLDNSFLDDGE